MNATDRAGEYNVYVMDDRVYFEHEELGEDDAICCFLQGKTVVDYDMAYGMLDEARTWLDANGYDTTEILG
jgi:hypothetical protein